MHQIVTTSVDSSRRWWVLAIVVAAQFMFGVDAFIVNVAIPTVAAELHASSAQIESTIAIYLIAHATLVVTGGRLGDIYGTKRVLPSAPHSLRSKPAGRRGRRCLRCRSLPASHFCRGCGARANEAASGHQTQSWGRN
jgi:Major Facilitator Superfamily